MGKPECKSGSLNARGIRVVFSARLSEGLARPRPIAIVSGKSARPRGCPPSSDTTGSGRRVHDGGSGRRFTTRVHDEGSRRGFMTRVHDEGSRRGFTAATRSEPTGSIGTGDERTTDGSSRPQRGFTRRFRRAFTPGFTPRARSSHAAALSVERVTPDPRRVTTCASRRGPALRCASHDRHCPPGHAERRRHSRTRISAAFTLSAAGTICCSRRPVVRLHRTLIQQSASLDTTTVVHSFSLPEGLYVRLPAARSMAMAGGSTWDVNMRICGRESQSTL